MSESKEIIDTVYHASLTTGVAVSSAMLLKKFMGITPPSFNKLDGMDIGKLVGIIAISDISVNYAINKGWIPKSIVQPKS